MDILVGHSSDAEGQAALDHAVREARAHDATLHVLRVIREPGTGNTQQMQQWRELRDRTEQEMAALASELEGQGLTVRVEAVPAEGLEASELLLRAAERIDADLIVLGIRRRSRVGKLMLGSNTQDVLLGTTRPVLAVKAE